MKNYTIKTEINVHYNKIGILRKLKIIKWVEKKIVVCAMIVSNLNKQIGNKNILQDVSFTLDNNDKVGLVGVNGAGKSTLLKILAKEMNFDKGKVRLNEETITYLKQEIPYIYNDLTIVEYVKQELKLDRLETRLHELENNLTEEVMEEYGSVLDQYLALDGYSFEDNLKSILLGLNFKENINNKIKTLSGGEKIKVLLVVVLLQNSDILLLDEPTNNLDMEAIEYLEKNLKSANKKMIIVSHDEVFLNNIVNKIYELENGKINVYNLSYQGYLNQKELEYKELKERYLKAQDQKDKLKHQVQKAKEWANKGMNKKAHNDNDKLANNYAKEKTNTSNISKLTKELKNIEIPDFEEKKPINVFFNLGEVKGNKEIELNHLVCGYETFKTAEINLLIPYGIRVNIIGGNGTGKTTLLKTILNEVSPIKGYVNIGSGVRIGYISQNTLDSDLDESIYSYLTKDIENIDKAKIFTLLDKLGIDYDDKDKSYLSLSPGERTRVNLAKLAINNINVLILDEVTNHLDKEALDLIYELVSSYTGTIISISHNRKYNEYLNSDIDLDIKTGKIIQRRLLKK